MMIFRKFMAIGTSAFHRKIIFFNITVILYFINRKTMYIYILSHTTGVSQGHCSPEPSCEVQIPYKKTKCAELRNNEISCIWLSIHICNRTGRVYLVAFNVFLQKSIKKCK